MEEEKQVRNGHREAISTKGYCFVILWAAFLLVLYAIGGFAGVRLLRSYAAEAARMRENKIESLSAGVSAQEYHKLIPPGARPVHVLVGGRVNHIGGFDLKGSSFDADFTIWFFWKDGVVNPGEDFRIANGRIIKREKGKSYRIDGKNYEEYHVDARITKFFDAYRFPFAKEVLLIEVEDTRHDVRTIYYTVDRKGSEIPPDVMQPAIILTRSLVNVGLDIYRAGPAEPGQTSGSTEARSRFFFAMVVEPDALSLYLKMFQALFASVAVTLIALCINPRTHEPRFALPIGGLFASVANNVFLTTLLPNANRLTLADMVNAAGLLTIFLVLVQSATALYFADKIGDERLSRFFDHISFTLFLAGYIAINLALPLAARPS